MLNVADNAVIQGYNQRLRSRWHRWINRRIPAARRVTLDQRRIFIFPTRVGFIFLGTLLVMLIAAINYQNNMSFALTFLLANLFVIAVLHTFSNLSGLIIQAVRATPVFAGQHAQFEITLSREGRRQYFSVHLKWPGNDGITVNVDDSDDVHLSLYVPTDARGWHNPGRLLVETVYPLGLLRAWSWVDLDIQALVYPSPIPTGPLPGLATDRPDGSSKPVSGNDDFYGFRDYRQGDSLRHVYWKAVAKGLPLQTKQYTAYADHSFWLDWNLFEGQSPEQRLSHLCHWVLDYDRSNEEYGVRLPGVTIAPDSGEKHRNQVLRQLALWGLPQ